MDRKIAMHKRLREISEFVDKMYGIDTCEDDCNKLTAEEELELTSEFANQAMEEYWNSVINRPEGMPIESLPNSRMCIGDCSICNHHSNCAYELPF